MLLPPPPLLLLLQAFARDVLRSVVIIFTVKRSLADRGFQASIHFGRPLLLGQGGPRTSNDDDGNPRLEVNIRL
jgi:hypothetical protein